MATKTYAELLTGAQQIKENELPESNTHDLVGEQLVHMVNRASEDKAALDATLTDHQEQLDKLQEDIDGNTEAIHDEQTRAEAAEKMLIEGLTAIRGSSTLTGSGTESSYILTMNIGKGGPVKLELPVHGSEDSNVPADTPALIGPWTFAELMGLFTSLENEAERAETAEKANAEAIARVEEFATNNNQIIVTQGKSIDALIAQTGSLKLVLTPNVVLRNVTTDVTVKAAFTSTLEPDVTGYIKILKDAEVINREDGISELSYKDSFAPVADVEYGAETWYSGKTLTAAQTLAVVDPIYAGAGAAYSDIVLDEHKQTARKSAAGTYNVTVANDGEYVWLLVPRGFAAIKKATLSGFDFPLETPTVVYVGGTSALTGGIPYSCYRSSNQYAAGNLSIVIS